MFPSSTPRRRIAPLAGLLLAVAATRVAAAQSVPVAPAPAPQVDKPAPAVKLAVGDPAPALRVGRWLRGDPVTSFEKERVYVVDFWATWAPPCRKSIAFLSELQTRFTERGVRVVGISVWEDDPKAAAQFVERLGDGFGYSVATDYVPEKAKPQQGSMYRGWMLAAVQDVLPTTFIVDRTGRVAWVGEPMAVEEPLAQVVAGTWDIEDARAKFHCRVRVNQLGFKLREQLGEKDCDWAAALQTIETMLQLDPGCESKVAAYRFLALLELGRDGEAYAYARKAVDGPLKEHALALNLIAWSIVDPKMPARASRKLDFALEVAERACTLTNFEDAAILDTLALVHFESGHVEKALEIQEKAARLAAGGRWQAEIEARLEQFREAVKKSK